MIQLVERMTLAPNSCMLCGCGNVANNDGTVGPFIDLGMDYNWGDSGYFCVPCGEKVALVVGWHTKEDMQSKDAELEKRDREIHDLRAKLEVVGRQKQAAINELQKIRDGSKALKRVRAKAS